VISCESIIRHSFYQYKADHNLVSQAMRVDQNVLGTIRNKAAIWEIYWRPPKNKSITNYKWSPISILFCSIRSKSHVRVRLDHCFQKNSAQNASECRYMYSVNHSFRFYAFWPELEMYFLKIKTNILGSVTISEQCTFTSDMYGIFQSYNNFLTSRSGCL
jgi:hypothetical protein